MLSQEPAKKSDSGKLKQAREGKSSGLEEEASCCSPQPRTTPEVIAAVVPACVGLMKTHMKSYT